MDRRKGEDVDLEPGQAGEAFNGLPPHRHWPVLYRTAEICRDPSTPQPMGSRDRRGDPSIYLSHGCHAIRSNQQPHHPVSVAPGSFLVASWDRFVYRSLVTNLPARRGESSVHLYRSISSSSLFLIPGGCQWSTSVVRTVPKPAWCPSCP